MSEPFLGEIRLVSFNFAPNGWALCNGQIMSIAQNTALFSLMGTTYGGNGTSTFALPNLQGRFAMHQGTGPGLTPRTWGETSGAENVTLISTEMPAHTHLINMNDNTAAIAAGGSNNYLNTKTESGESVISTAIGAAVTANPNSLGVAGGSQPHNNMPPYLVLNYIIALQGIYPSRA